MSSRHYPHLPNIRRQTAVAACVTLTALLIAGCSAGSQVFDNQNTTDNNAGGTSESPEIGAATSEPTGTVQVEQTESSPASTPGESELAASGPIACGSIDLNERLSILELINETRATGRQCGSDWYPATTPVTWNDQLEAAAAVHSTDLATHDIFSHTGTDGSSVGDRATTQGYVWNRIGENIAAGQPSIQDAMQGWIDSPGHCRNLMQPDYSNVAVACVTNTDSTYGSYWTQVFGNEL